MIKKRKMKLYYIAKRPKRKIKENARLLNLLLFPCFENAYKLQQSVMLILMISLYIYLIMPG